MGAYSTTPLRSDASAGDAPAAESTPSGESTAQARTVSAILSRILAWLIFVGGLVGAVLGIAGLHVEITVAGLILACTAGLVLLRLRTGTESETGDEVAAD